MIGLTALSDGFDDVPTDLNSGFQWGIKLLIAVFLFGIALDSKPADFRAVLRRPAPFGILLLAQYVVLPAMTVGLIALLDPYSSVALGMIFVIYCPSGSASNLITHRARGDVALSVSLTTFSNAVALVATPLAFAFWGSLSPTTDALATSIHLDAAALGVEIAFLIGMPFVLGILVAQRWPVLTARIKRPFAIGALVLLILLAGSALAANAAVLVPHLGAVAVAVVVQNAISFIVGYAGGRVCRLPEPGRRSMTIEVGMRNTGLALVLVLAYFDGLGGAVLLVAAWAVWDLVVGLSLAEVWRHRGSTVSSAQSPAGSFTP